MKIHEYNEMMRYLTRPKEDPIFKQYLQGGRVGLKPGGLVEPGVMHYGRLTEAEKRANVKTWEKNTGLNFEDVEKKFVNGTTSSKLAL